MASIKDNLTAIIPPHSGNDLTQGYGPGSEWFDIARGSMHKCLDATAGSASWMELDIHRPAWAVGDYRVPAHIAQVSDSSAITPDLLTMQPVFVGRRTQIDRLALRVTTAQPGAAARIGLFATDPETHAPAALVVDAGELDLSEFNGDRWRTISVSLKPGLYWTACIMKPVGTMPVVRRVGGALYGHLPTSTLTELAASAAFRYLSASWAYGALPATAPAMMPDSGTHGPIVALRRSM